MSDIVERLREGCGCNFPETTCMAESECADAFEAADTITALRAEVEMLRDEATRIAHEAQKVCLQNIQMKFALGYPMDANLEKYVLPENPFKCGTCAALRAALSTARADALEEAARVVLEQRCERGTPWDNACLDAAAAIRALKEGK